MPGCLPCRAPRSADAQPAPGADGVAGHAHAAHRCAGCRWQWVQRCAHGWRRRAPSVLCLHLGRAVKVGTARHHLVHRPNVLHARTPPPHPQATSTARRAPATTTTTGTTPGSRTTTGTPCRPPRTAAGSGAGLGWSRARGPGQAAGAAARARHLAITAPRRSARCAQVLLPAHQVPAGAPAAGARRVSDGAGGAEGGGGAVVAGFGGVPALMDGRVPPRHMRADARADAPRTGPDDGAYTCQHAPPCRM